MAGCFMVLIRHQSIGAGIGDQDLVAVLVGDPPLQAGGERLRKAAVSGTLGA